jgi:uncharacterized membrane protein
VFTLKHDQLKKQIIPAILLCSVIGMILSLGLYWKFLHHLGISDDPTCWGLLGDYLSGTLGAIFGFLSIVLLCITLIIQIQEASNTAYYSGMQSFESNLYELFRSHKDNFKSFEAYRTGVKYFGYNAMGVLINDIRHEVFNNEGEADEAMIKIIIAKYGELYKQNIFHLDHYFRTLFQILIHIDNSKFLKDEDKYRYVDFIKAQLMALEFYILFLHTAFLDKAIQKQIIKKYFAASDLPDEDAELINLKHYLAKNFTVK